MQEISAWFLVLSVMILFFAIVMNMYTNLFTNIVPANDEYAYSSNHIIHKQVSKSANNNKKSRSKNIDLKQNAQRMQRKQKSSSNMANKLNEQRTSRIYQNTYTSYREYKKYNTVSR